MDSVRISGGIYGDLLGFMVSSWELYQPLWKYTWDFTNLDGAIVQGGAPPANVRGRCPSI